MGCASSLSFTSAPGSGRHSARIDISCDNHTAPLHCGANHGVTKGGGAAHPPTPAAPPLLATGLSHVRSSAGPASMYISGKWQLCDSESVSAVCQIGEGRPGSAHLCIELRICFAGASGPWHSASRGNTIKLSAVGVCCLDVQDLHHEGLPVLPLSIHYYIH